MWWTFSYVHWVRHKESHAFPVSIVPNPPPPSQPLSSCRLLSSPSWTCLWGAAGWQWAGLVGLLLGLDSGLLNELFSMAQRTRLDQMFSPGVVVKDLQHLIGHPITAVTSCQRGNNVRPTLTLVGDLLIDYRHSNTAKKWRDDAEHQNCQTCLKHLRWEESGKHPLARSPGLWPQTDLPLYTPAPALHQHVSLIHTRTHTTPLLFLTSTAQDWELLPVFTELLGYHKNENQIF